MIIDMQRDFVDPGGFGEALGNDVSLLRTAIAPTERVLDAGRASSACWSSTRARAIAPTCRDLPACQEGARPPDDRHRRSRARWAASWCAASTAMTSSTSSSRRRRAGASTSRARALSTRPTSRRILRNRGITSLIVMRRHHRGLRPHHRPRSQRPRLRLPGAVGLRRLVLPGVPGDALEMIKAQGGIFGWVAPSEALLAASTDSARVASRGERHDQ